MDRKRVPPPLPPRKPSSKPVLHVDSPPPYEPIGRTSRAPTFQAADRDPRSNSTESLVPTNSNVQNDRRKLLCIYIHGFMGDVTSFQSFPAHVHNLLTLLLARTHVVHTKMYPRYRSKKDMSFARDDFSRWLTPHESSTTDVVLLGHSMGGLLTAEVVLKPDPYHGTLLHRILGTINFDVPFLGMHPGVIKSGLASIFAPAPEPPSQPATPGATLSPVTSPMESSAASVYSNDSAVTSPTSGMLELTPSQQMDPNFNPAFDNDVNLPVRKGWRNVLHFVNKHSDSFGEFSRATKQLVTSHMEFGGAMANYSTLKLRYTRIRALEEQSEAVRKSVVSDAASTPPRVRFINYYTASTGRPKKPKTSEVVAAEAGDVKSLKDNPDATSLDKDHDQIESDPDERSGVAQTTADDHSSAKMPGTSVRSSSPRLSLDEYSDEGVIHKDLEDVDPEPMNEMNHLDPQPVPSSDEFSEDDSFADAMEDMNMEHESNVQSQTSTAAPSIAPSESTLSLAPSQATTLSPIQSLPPIPDVPPKPEAPDFSAYTDADTRKIVEKDYARSLKTYEKTVKDREKAIRDRAKLAEKLERKAKKEAEKAAKDKAASRVQEFDEKLKLERRETDREWKEIQRDDQAEQDAKVKANPGLADKHTDAEKELRDGEGGPKDKKEEVEKVQQDRKFCMLPPKDSRGLRDPCWVRVFMKNVDEVGAHCGLFFPSETYEGLVSDTAARIEEWVGEAESERVVRELEMQG